MNELVIPPSPSWFEVDILTCAPDNTVIYASLHDIVIVKPTPEDKSNDVVIITRAHCLKIKCVNINPNWGSPHKYIVSLGEDKIVNLWDAESLKKINQHNRHINEKSPGSVVGASFAEDDVVVSVLENGDVIKWNILRNETHILKFLHGSKITVFSICPHARWMVAFGLKNGQIFIGDLRKDGKILYKLTGHQRPVLSLSWCPVSVNIFPAKVPDKNESVSEVTSNDNRNKQQGYSKKNKDKKKRNSNKDSINLSSNIATCKDLAENVTSEIESPTDRRITSMDISHSVERMPTEIYLRSPGNASEVLKELSNTNNSMLNITNSSSPKEGNRFNYGTPTSGNQSIEFSSTSSCKQNLSLEPKLQGISSASDNLDAQALHLNDEKDNTSYWRNGIQSGKEFLLASAAREWDIYIWRAGTDGKVETFFSIPQSQGQRGGNIQEKFWITICWVSPNILLSSSRSADLLAWTLPKPTDSSKSYRVVTKRHNQVLFTIKAPVIYSNVYDKSFPICTKVWTTGMERLILNTDLVTGYILSSTQTFGSGINCLVASSLDPNRVLIGTGSGGLHILEADKFGKKHVDAPCIHSKTSSGVTAAAWSPIDEKILAFGTSEGRVGVFLNSDRSKTPKFLRPYFTMDILKIEWGPLIGDDQLGLYVQCDCKVAIYNPREIHREPLIVKVPDNMSSYTMSWKPDFSRFLVATKEGAVVIYNRDMEVINVSYLPTKLQSINWHPYAVMGDSTSKYSSTFVSISKGVNVTIYILTKNFGNIQECAVVHYENPKTITSVSWDPHTGKRLVILDERAVAQIYDVESGTIISTYINSGLEWLLHACWSPVDDDLVMVGTQKGKLIIWKISEHPPVPDEQVTAYKKNVKKQLQNVSSKPRNIEPNRIRQPDIKLALSLPFLNIKNHNKIAEDLKKFLYYKTMNNAEELTTDVSGNADLLDALGAQSRFQQVLERNISNLKQSGQYPNSDMLSLLNGDIQATIMEAIDQKRVTPWIITLCPMVSDRVWKQACATYALQLQEDSNSNPLEVVTYLLACHQVEESIYYLCDQEMFKEAFVLAKTRFGENSPMLKTVSQKWATRLVHNGNFELAALCYLSMDKFKDAASVLFRRSDVKLLEIALEIAEVSGNEELVKSVKFRCQTFKPQLDARQVAENRKVSVIEEELAADSENNELPDVKADDMCSICQDGLKQMIFSCRHGLCEICADKFSRTECPICRRK
ncbi:gem nuclear organelle associated protein rigor mortis [Rhynchophorus ferrugineus]|uniref:gem nuclear organelle associated protein rigor mortis n=1 Tax=Rhynchophorus ferrugineus TaxID=354439 RepID=UPI003FCEB5C7